MLTTKRYENLMEMLNNEGYNVSEFIDGNKSPYFILNKEDGNLYFTVTQEIDYLEICLEAYAISLKDYYVVETKKYKQAKTAFNYLQKLL